MRHAHRNILVALVGQPNCGKSTVFNMLTGLSQHVANFPGVTVEKKQGAYEYGDNRVEVIDLPGTYSLTSFSQEERIARDFILLQRPEVVVMVADASNLERHLYLIFQILEMRVPAVLCLNMIDVATRRGFHVHVDRLSEQLHVPVIPTNARKGQGAEELRKAIQAVCASGDHKPAEWRLDYGEPLEPVLQAIEANLTGREHLMEDFSARWLAVKLMEEDTEARRILLHHTHDGRGPETLSDADEKREAFVSAQRKSPARIIASRRHERARAIVERCVHRDPRPARTLTDRVDAFVCNRFLGLPLAVVCLFAAFSLAFRLAQEWRWVPGGADLTNADNWYTLTGLLGRFFEVSLPSLLQDMQTGAVRSLLEDGIIRGVGGVVSLVPIVFFMFLLLAMLEDSGYLARIAFLLDGFFRRFGLPGNSVLPMVIAGGIPGGCAVPAILSTRALHDKRDRLTTMLVLPFMNCGGKLPVYLVLIGAFFADHQGMVLGLLVLLSWLGALGVAFLLRRTAVPGVQAPLMLELPAYNLPTAGGVLQSAGQRSWLFLKKAGTVILAVNVVLWALLYFPRPASAPPPAAASAAPAATAVPADAAQPSAAVPAEADQLEAPKALRAVRHSFGGRIGRAIEPVSQLAGFDWRDNIALIGGFGAKEVIISTLGTAYSLDEAGPDPSAEGSREHPLARRLHTDPDWTSLRAFALMIFVMFYAPCLPAVVVLGRESGTWKWALFAIVYSTALAFVFATLIYQGGRLLGLG